MDHEAFTDVVATAAQLDREDAERATRPVLQTLAERIDRVVIRALFRVRTPTEGSTAMRSAAIASAPRRSRSSS